MSFNSIKNKPEDVVKAWRETIKLTAKLKKLQDKRKKLAQKPKVKILWTRLISVLNLL